MNWKVELFATASGKMPVSKFFRKLDDSTLDKVFRVLDILAKYGPQTPQPYAKKITNQISELRTSGKNAIRLLYSRNGNKYVILHGFKKKTQKLPKKELEIAMKRASYLS